LVFKQPILFYLPKELDFDTLVIDIIIRAVVAKLVDALDLGSSEQPS